MLGIGNRSFDTTSSCEERPVQQPKTIVILKCRVFGLRDEYRFELKNNFNFVKFEGDGVTGHYTRV